jgi:hypothetical protein
MVQKLIWSENALNQKISTFEYWTERTGSKKYPQQIEKEVRNWLKLLKKFPNIGIDSELLNVKSVTINKYFKLYYRINNSTLEILHFWDVRRNPAELE